MEENEKEIQNAILSFLNISGNYAWRNNSAFVKTNYTTKAGIQKHGAFRAGIKGGSDILGICGRDGKLIAIECKRKGQKATPVQEMFLNEIKAKGGYCGVAHSLDEAIQIMKPII